MAYTNTEAREQLLDTVAGAAEAIGFALMCLGEAYELLDESSGERLEQELFRPVQAAYGRLKRTHAEFAARHDLQSRTFAQATVGAPSHGVKGFLDNAMEAIGKADGELAGLQDSMLPVEVGDVQLRAGLEEVRKVLGELRGRARAFLRTLGR